VTDARTREWASFEDPTEDRTWLFDITFLASNWQCIFGAGCQGILTAPAPELVHGCCSYGAHFADKDDLEHIETIAKTLSSKEWQYKSKAKDKGIARRKGKVTITRVVDGACIFLNRPGFPTGPGCALHQVAETRGVEPWTLKPTVCWQVPIRREDTSDSTGHVTSTITEWQRRHWGAGGDEFGWWCTEAPEAHTGAEPVYRYMSGELRELTGDAPYAFLVEYCTERETQRSQGAVFLPHPAVRSARAEAPAEE
jgi:hypothetical protein